MNLENPQLYIIQINRHKQFLKNKYKIAISHKLLQFMTKCDMLSDCSNQIRQKILVLHHLQSQNITNARP